MDVLFADATAIIKSMTASPYFHAGHLHDSFMGEKIVHVIGTTTQLYYDAYILNIIEKFAKFHLLGCLLAFIVYLQACSWCH